MKFDIISFDLQGTLSDSAFSDEFWIKTLPKLYSQHKKITVDEAKEILRAKFDKYGKYDFRYYSINYWVKELGRNINLKGLQKIIKNKPFFFKGMLKLVKSLHKKVKLIIISSTTNEFINIEVGEHKIYFDKIYSSLDDFNIAGKPTELYLKIANTLQVHPSKILHVGDNYEMDIENAKKAGFKTFYFDKSQSLAKLIKNLRQVI